MSDKAPKVTLRTLAAEAGVSPATVMRALNNHPNVTQGIRRKVIALAMKRNYQLPEHYAKLIAVIVPDGSSFDGYTGQLLNALSQEFLARKLQFEVIVGRNIETVHEHAYSGVISTIWETGLEKQWPEEHTLPLVVLNAASNILGGIYQVTSDEKQGITMGLEYLLQHGRRRIAFVSTPLHDNPNALERVKAFNEFCRENHLFPGCFHEEHTIDNPLERIARTVIEKKADAIFASSETYGFEILHYLRRSDIRIPQDIAMLTLELPRFSPFTSPPLTTIGQDFKSLAFHAVETLLCRIKNEPCKQKISVPYLFFERESV